MNFKGIEEHALKATGVPFEIKQLISRNRLDFSGSLNNSDRNNPFIIQSLREKWHFDEDYKFKPLSPRPANSPVFKRKQPLKPTLKIRSRILNRKYSAVDDLTKEQKSKEVLNETLIIKYANTNELNNTESANQRTFNNLNNIKKFKTKGYCSYLLNNLPGLFLLIWFQNKTTAKNAPIRKRIKSLINKGLISINSKLKLANPVFISKSLYFSSKQQSISTTKTTHIRINSSKENQSKTFLPSKEKAITSSLVAAYLYRLSKKYKLLTSRSLRIKKYKALRKKWLLRKARKKNQKGIERNRHGFFNLKVCLLSHQIELKTQLHKEPPLKIKEKIIKK